MAYSTYEAEKDHTGQYHFTWENQKTILYKKSVSITEICNVIIMFMIINTYL